MSNKKKRGVKRGSDDHRAYTERRERDRKLDRDIIRTEGVIKGQEDIIIALGRMGWGPKRFADLDKVLRQVVREYHDMAVEDVEADKECEYTVDRYDRELKSCVGEDHFLPWNIRYDPAVYTEGIRSIQLKEILDTAIAEKEKADGEKD